MTNYQAQQPDYSILLSNNSDFCPSWENYYNFDLSYPENILNLVRQASILPYDFYRIIAAYALIPSALVNRVPYLFFYGVSGSGKSTFGKLIANIHGVHTLASNTTYAAIRNIIRENKKIVVTTFHDDPKKMPESKLVEANTMLVWEDVDDDTFKKNPNIYTLFKVGYDRATDTVVIAGKEQGTIDKYRCFNPKVFSSIYPIHTLEDYNELRRRLIVIPTKRLDDIDTPLLNIDNINWQGFNHKFNEFWSLQQAEIFLTIRKSLTDYPSSLKGLNSQQKTISWDLAAVGVSTGIWADETEAVQDLKACFDWLKKDVQSEADNLEKLLTEFIANVENNAKQTDSVPCVYSQQLRTIIFTWHSKAWLLEKPTNKVIKYTMNKLGYKINEKGQWMKQEY